MSNIIPMPEVARADAQPADRDERLQRIALLAPIDRDLAIKQFAKSAGVSPKAVRDELKRHESIGGAAQGQPLTFTEPDTWPTAVPGGQLIVDLVGRIRRHVVLTGAQATAVAHWAILTWAVEYLDFAPRLAITSTEKGCGKTTLLDVLENLVSRALGSGSLSGAAVARVIGPHQPTLLLDETDTYLSDNDLLRGVLNQGHKKGATVAKCVGDENNVMMFPVFSFVALACKGKLPETIEDRSIVIAMKRAKATERPQRIRAADRAAMMNMRARCKRFIMDAGGALHDCDPPMPPWLSNRQADNWRGLFAVADIAGTRSELLEAARALMSDHGREADSTPVLLVRDIVAIFDEQEVKRMGSEDLMGHLRAREDRPWADWRGRGLTQHAIASLLRGFRIGPNDIRFSPAPSDVKKGYERSQFEDVLERFAPDFEALHRDNPGDSTGSGKTSTATTESDVAVTDAPGAAENNDCSDVADERVSI